MNPVTATFFNQFSDVIRGLRFHREGIALIILYNLGRPTGARELAELMNIREATAARYLLILSVHRLVTRTRFRQGYELTKRGLQLLEILCAALSIPLFEDDDVPAGDYDPREDSGAVGISPDWASSGDLLPDPHHVGSVQIMQDQPEPIEIRQDPAPAGKNPRLSSPAAAAGISQVLADKGTREPVKKAPQPDALNQQFGQNAQFSDAQTRQTGQKAQFSDAQNQQSGQKAQFSDAQNQQSGQKAQVSDIQNQQFAQNAQLPVNINDSDINLINDFNDLKDSEEYLLSGEPPAKNQHFSQDKAHVAVWEELFAAGINVNPRTRALVNQPYVTPEYVKGHRLKLEATGKRGPKYAGLLVTILESGEPAPRLNGNGHLADCECLDCERFRLLDSWSSWVER